MALKIRFLLTSRCTATCAYCHNEGQSKQGASLLHLASIQAVLDALAETHTIPTEIVLSGGEPTLHKQVGEIARRCKATGATVSMDSHGAHPQWLKTALPYLDELKLHVDSFDATQQQQRMGLDIAAVLSSIQLAQQFPTLKLHLNHPLHDITESIAFIQQARTLGVNCKIIELFGDATCRVNLRTVYWEKLGYQLQDNGDWLHQNGKHRLFHKRCGAKHNTEPTLFISAEGIRYSLEGAIISPLSGIRALLQQAA